MLFQQVFSRHRFRVCAMFVMYLVLSVVAGAEDSLPPATLVWDLNFNDQPVDQLPRAASKEELEAFLNPDTPDRFPLRIYQILGYVTDTRQALVKAESVGLSDQPLEFSFTENGQPNYGPIMVIAVPPDLAKRGARWKLEMDVARESVGKSGGIELSEIANCRFHEDGTLRNGNAGIGRYAGGVPLHLCFLINTEEKDVRIVVNNDEEHAIHFAWNNSKANAFTQLRLHGQLPGGHAEAPARLAFDNIKLTLLKAREE